MAWRWQRASGHRPAPWRGPRGGPGARRGRRSARSCGSESPPAFPLRHTCLPCPFMYIPVFSSPPFVHMKTWLTVLVCLIECAVVKSRLLNRPCRGQLCSQFPGFRRHSLWEAAQSTCVISFPLDEIIALMFAYKGSSYHVSNTSNSMSPTPRLASNPVGRYCMIKCLII